MVQLQTWDGAIIPADYPLFSRARRDQAVIYDPGVAPLVLPVVQDGDLHRFACAEPALWAIQVSAAAAADWAGELVRRPGLRLLLGGTAWGLERPCRVEGALPAELPWIVVSDDGTRAAQVATRCLVAAPLRVCIPADATTLALLCSVPELQRPAAAATLPEPEPELAARLAAAATAARAVQLQRLQRAVQLIRRLHRDFAPPGIERSTQLREWADWSFARLAAEIEVQFRNAIPGRFVPIWQQLHADAVAGEQDDRRELSRLQQLIAQAAAPLWTATAAER
jgi:hypothetical protein